MTTTEITLSEPTGCRHIRVWWTSKVIAWYDYEGVFDIEAFLEYTRNVICAGLKKEDFDLSHMDGSRLEDIYLRRFENAKL